MKMKYAFVALSIIIAGGCDKGQPKQVELKLYNSTGDEMGTAKMSEQPNGVEIKLKVKGVSPGPHGLHVHEIGQCEGPLFSSAGNHFNPDQKEHGLLNEKGPENGDLPNVTATSAGEINSKIVATNISFLEGKKTLRRKSGTSLIITESPDDGMTQPAGNSGKRIICGVITEKVKES
ncbi:superoxide dismutase family protein [Ectobacillus polymachus]|uniref:superoxide dismutase family protein n=1 Tax=Ectobacillus polymachus TaxID=1508806 RepID=UPI003A87D2A1